MIDDIKNYAKNKCGDKIKFTGFLSDVDSIIRETDIGVLCTKIENHAEGISNAILEFMAHGKPVVATDTGGTPEIIENNLSGFLVKPNNPNELAEKILNLIESNDLRINMGRRGAAIVKNKFSLDVMARKFKDLYHDSQ